MSSDLLPVFVRLSMLVRQASARYPQAARLPAQHAVPFSTVHTRPDRLDVPLRRRKPTRYFVDSMADLFHEDVPAAYLNHVFATMTPAQQFVILTMRRERMVEYPDGLSIRRVVRILGTAPQRTVLADHGAARADAQVTAGRLSNVWLGASAANQKAWDERVPYLADAPRRVRFARPNRCSARSTWARPRPSTV